MDVLVWSISGVDPVKRVQSIGRDNAHVRKLQGASSRLQLRRALLRDEGRARDLKKREFRMSRDDWLNHSRDEKVAAGRNETCMSVNVNIVNVGTEYVVA